MISVNFWPNFIALASLGYYAGLDSRRRVRRPRRSQWLEAQHFSKAKGITLFQRLCHADDKSKSSSSGFEHTHLVRNEPRNSNYTRNETSSTQITLQKITRISVLITWAPVVPRTLFSEETQTRQPFVVITCTI